MNTIGTITSSCPVVRKNVYDKRPTLCVALLKRECDENFRKLGGLKPKLQIKNIHAKKQRKYS